MDAADVPTDSGFLVAADILLNVIVDPTPGANIVGTVVDIGSVGAEITAIKAKTDLLPAVAAGAKGGLPILDASTGLILTGYNSGAVTTTVTPGSLVTATFGTCVLPAGSIVTATFGTCVLPAGSIVTATFGTTVLPETAKTNLLNFHGTGTTSYVKSNLYEINDVAAICEITRAAGARTVVDGVSYAPHGFPNVTALGCDVYLFSAYKTFGPHQGIMVLREAFGMELPGQAHFFNQGTLYKRHTPAGPDHAQIAACAGMADYVDAIAAAQEEQKKQQEREAAKRAALLLDDA
jgi:hypothetical protein